MSISPFRWYDIDFEQKKIKDIKTYDCLSFRILFLPKQNDKNKK